MYILKILTWSLETYVIRLHNLISMNIFLAESFSLYDAPKTKKIVELKE